METRLAVETDFQAMLEMSEGLYGGLDYLPHIFTRCLNHVDCLVIVAQTEGRVIGLTAVHVADEGKAIFHFALRIHPEYRGRNFASKLLRATRQYIDKHFPLVETERSTVMEMYGPEGAVVMRKSAFSPILQFASMSCVVNHATFNRLPTTPPKDLTTEMLNGNSLTINEFKDLIEDGNLNDIVPKNILLICAHPYRIHSNISEGILQAQDYIFAFTDPESKAVQSLSHGRMSRKMLYCNWISMVYVSDPKQLNLHIYHQLEAAISRSDGKTFFFQCIFDKESLLASAKKFTQEDASFKTLDIKWTDAVTVFQKDY